MVVFAIIAGAWMIGFTVGYISAWGKGWDNAKERLRPIYLESGAVAGRAGYKWGGYVNGIETWEMDEEMQEKLTLGEMALKVRRHLDRLDALPLPRKQADVTTEVIH